MEVELERIILSQVWGVAPVLKSSVEHTEPSAHHKLGRKLISQAHAWSKVGFLGDSQRRIVAVDDVDAVLLRQAGETIRLIGSAGEGRILAPYRNQVLRSGTWRAGDEVRLGAEVLFHLAKEVPTQPKVQRQLGHHLPVILEIHTVVVAAVVRVGHV